MYACACLNNYSLPIQCLMCMSQYSLPGQFVMNVTLQVGGCAVWTEVRWAGPLPPTSRNVRRTVTEIVTQTMNTLDFPIPVSHHLHAWYTHSCTISMSSLL